MATKGLNSIVNYLLLKFPQTQLVTQNNVVNWQDLRNLLMQIATTCPQYQEASFTGQLSGFTTTVNISVDYRIIGSVAAVTFPATTGTSTGISGTSMILSGVPAALQTTITSDVPIYLEDAGVVLTTAGVLQATSSSSSWTFGKVWPTGGGFTTAGIKGIPVTQTIIVPLT